MEEQDGQPDERVDLGEVDDDADAPPRGTILGAIGQLGAAVLVVILLVLAFFGSSAALRRLFG